MGQKNNPQIQLYMICGEQIRREEGHIAPSSSQKKIQRALAFEALAPHLLGNELQMQVVANMDLSL